MLSYGGNDSFANFAHRGLIGDRNAIPLNSSTTHRAAMKRQTAFACEDIKFYMIMLVPER